MTRPTKDAVVVQRLRAAGVIVIAKSNLSEWANFRDKRSSSGWSATGGQCHNPHVLDRSPGGSSSGSGAGVAAGFAPLSVGTETDGSILCPAALNGVVGIKPTVGLTSRTGVVPVSSSQDTVGPIARSVAEAAAFLGVLAGSGAGADPLDPVTTSRPADLPKDYMAFCDPDGLSGVRVGVPRRHYFGYSAEADALVEAALQVARKAGAVIVDPADVATAEAISQSNDEMTVMLHEYKAGVETYLATRPTAPGQPRTVAEIVAFNQDHAADELAFFGQDILVAACEAGGLDNPTYLEARAAQLAKGAPRRDRRCLRGRKRRRARLPDNGPGLVHRPRQWRLTHPCGLPGRGRRWLPGDKPAGRQGRADFRSGFASSAVLGASHCSSGSPSLSNRRSRSAMTCGRHGARGWNDPRAVNCRVRSRSPSFPAAE